MLYKEKLKNLRTSQKMSQLVLGEKVGRSLKTIQRWEAGITEPPDFAIKQMAEVLSVPVSEISDIKLKENCSVKHSEAYLSYGKIIFDFSTKTESEKQKALFTQYQQLQIKQKEINYLNTLVESQKKIIESVDCLIFKKNRQFQYTYANKKFLAYFNIPSINAIIGYKNIEIWQSFDIWKEFTALEQEVFRTGIPIEDYVISIPKYIGEGSIGLISIKPLYDSEGNVEEIVISIFDVTADSSIKEKFYYMESALDRIEQAISITKKSPKPHNIYVNDAFQRIYKCDKRTFYANPMKWMDFITFDEKQYVISKINDSNELTYKIVLDDNTVKWIKHRQYNTLINKEPIEFSVIEDITSLVSERELVEFIGSSIDNMEHGIAITDVESLKYLYINNALSQICGYSIEFLYNVGHSFWRDNIVAEIDILTYKKTLELAKCQEEGDKIIKAGYKIKCFDGTLKPIEVWTKTSIYKNNNYRVSIIKSL